MKRLPLLLGLPAPSFGLRHQVKESSDGVESARRAPRTFPTSLTEESTPSLLRR
jgi:hypothetical protein